MKLGLAIGAAWVAALIFYLVDMPTHAGAHPQWATQVLLSGVVIGTMLAIVTMRVSVSWRMIGFSVVAVISYLIANTGKNRFAASYAEDAFAGQMWYFGWHALCAFMVAGVIAGTHAQLTSAKG